MNDQDEEVLKDLSGGEWLRPLDVGGTDASHHSRTLARLVKLGLAERQKRGTITNVLRNGRRGSYVYRITLDGEKQLSYNGQAQVRRSAKRGGNPSRDSGLGVTCSALLAARS